jgi:hypothetical protein
VKLKLSSLNIRPILWSLALAIGLFAMGSYAYELGSNSVPVSTPTASPKPPATPTPVPTLDLSVSIAPTAAPTAKPTPQPIFTGQTGGLRFADTKAAASVSAASTITAAETALRTFAAQYNLTLNVTAVTPSAYAASYDTFSIIEESNLQDLKDYGLIFIDEWSKYPADWVAASGLKSINLVKKFATDGTFRAAGPDPGDAAMYYDVGYGHDDYAREVIHHEFDHLIEYNAFGDYTHADPAWSSYNPADFSYGTGGAACYLPNSTCLTGEHPLAGFVTGYAASGMEEDKAETYAYLMTDTYYHHLTGWLGADTNLAQKVAAYKTFIASRSPEMTGDYFARINP